MNIDEAVSRIEKLNVRNLAAIGQRIMSEEAPKGETKWLSSSIDAQPINAETWSVGTDCGYAKYVARGRGPVRPVNRKALRWFDGPEPVFAKYASKTEPNEFDVRTAEKLYEYVRSIE